ncbi:hypothetical protein ERY430_60200 [Erythrobacter sp. EC-HK427]|nr:hypothetical protein ERY430_60200 [Erythrobacter sp. EC-HK427]
MAHHIGDGEARDADPLDAFEPLDRIGEAAHPVAAGDIDLPRVAAHHHAAVLAEAGEEHLHLFLRGVLRFVENDEGIGQCPPAHKGDGGDFDFAAGQPPLDLFGRHRIIQRIVERPQVRIDLLLHVAGQEAELFARLHRRAREDQALHRTGDQLADRLRHRQIGLARACRTEREDHVAAGELAHIVGLHRAARRDRLLAGADHDRRSLGIARDNAFQRRFIRHADQRIDRACIQFLARHQLFVHFDKHIARPRHIIRHALDHHPVPARGDIHAQPVFDLHQIGVKLPEERAEHSLFVKPDFDPCAPRMVVAGFGMGDGGGVGAVPVSFASHVGGSRVLSLVLHGECKRHSATGKRAGRGWRWKVIHLSFRPVA